MEQYLSSNEPQALADIGIDYNYLEFYSVLVTIQFSPDKHTELHCLVSIIDKYLILKSQHEVQTKNKQQILWQCIDLWKIAYKYCEQRLSSEDLTLKLQENLNDDFLISVVFQTESDFSNFEYLVKQICLITSPTIGEYLKLQKTIGQGSQATIELYQTNSRLDPQKFAVKTYEDSYHRKLDSIKELVMNEILFLRELNFCENVISLESVHVSENKIQLVMNFAMYGTLNEYIQESCMSEINIRYIMEQLVLTIDLFHRQDILHRDIKPDNILLLDREELTVCLADLGFACRITEKEQIRSKCGTPGFVDPEVLRGQPFSKKSDIFSLGCLLYNLISGKNLFIGKNFHAILIKNQTIDPEPIIDATCQHVSLECKDLLKKMINQSPTLRPSTEQVLQHPWFGKDHESLQNILNINRQQSIIHTLQKQQQNTVHQFKEQASFCMGANFGPLHAFNNNSSSGGVKSLSHSNNTPLTMKQFQTTSPMKLSYSILLKDKTSKAKVQSYKVDNFSIAHKICDSYANKRVTNSIYKRSSKELLALNFQQLRDNNHEDQGNNNVDSFSSIIDNDYLEYDYDNEVERKIQRRVHINDLFIEERLLAIKNKRKKPLLLHCD